MNSIVDPCSLATFFFLMMCRMGNGESIPKEEVVLSVFKEAMTHLLLKKPSLDLTIMDNFHPISKLSFLGNLLRRWSSYNCKDPWIKEIIWTSFSRITDLGMGSR